MSKSFASNDRQRQIEQVVESYLRALDAGTADSIDIILRQYGTLLPELEEALRRAIAVHEARGGHAASATNYAGSAGSDTEDLPPTVTSDSLDARERDVRDAVKKSARTVEDWIPGYRILVPGSANERLRGGQGSIYKAIQLATNRRVAIKMLNQATDASARKRFEREIDLIRKFKHPNIVTIYDAGETKLGQPYYVMELVENALHIDDYVHGRDANGLPIREKLSLEETLDLFDQACDAVQYAHQKGVIHRDLKPANILIQLEQFKKPDGNTSTRPHVKVVDFGLAKSETSDSVTLESRALIGTLHYMAPEQVAVRPDLIDIRTDLYALGVVLYELLTGSLPYEVKAKSEDQVRQEIRDGIKRTPSQVWTKESGLSSRRRSRRSRRCPIEHDLETVLLKALKSEPQRRYATVEQFAEDLERYKRGDAIEARRDSRWYVFFKTITSRRYRRPIGVAALLIISVSLVGAFGYREWSAAKLEGARKLRAAEIERWTDVAKHWTETKEWEKADEAYFRARQLSPDDGLLLTDWARMKYKQAKEAQGEERFALLRTASDLCGQALLITPGDYYSHNMHGMYLRETGLYEDAVAAFERAAQLEPSDFSVWDNLGKGLALLGEFDRAEECFQNAARIAQEETNPLRRVYGVQCWRDLASLQFFRGSPDAHSSIETAASWNPQKDQDAPSFILRARMLLEDGKHEDARRDMEFAVRIATKVATKAKAHRMLALINIHDEEFSAAIESAKKAIEFGDMGTINHLIIAIAEAELGNEVEGRTHLDKANELWPENVSNEEGYLATASEGFLWFDTWEQLADLRGQAERVIRGDSPAPSSR